MPVDEDRLIKALNDLTRAVASLHGDMGEVRAAVLTIAQNTGHMDAKLSAIQESLSGPGFIMGKLRELEQRLDAAGL